MGWLYTVPQWIICCVQFQTNFGEYSKYLDIPKTIHTTKATSRTLESCVQSLTQLEKWFNVLKSIQDFEMVSKATQSSEAILGRNIYAKTKSTVLKKQELGKFQKSYEFFMCTYCKENNIITKRFEGTENLSQSKGRSYSTVIGRMKLALKLLHRSNGCRVVQFRSVKYSRSKFRSRRQALTCKRTEVTQVAMQATHSNREEVTRHIWNSDRFHRSKSKRTVCSRRKIWMCENSQGICRTIVAIRFPLHCRQQFIQTIRRRAMKLL